MMTGKINQRVVAERLVWIERMVAQIRALPLSSLEEFLADARNRSAVGIRMISVR